MSVPTWSLDDCAHGFLSNALPFLFCDFCSNPLGFAGVSLVVVFFFRFLFVPEVVEPNPTVVHKYI